ncbi:MAG: hypothetical protein DWQ18_08585 [Crenarchaeota archaeon]|nr:MAG: hypothetical protein DWQ17_01200 [Thermoproteota archaeon]RDJ33197.1 MAG: hypothetical protein DWQ18_08585 [Thermoproteota archaeon]RDJ36300.1 MAG: hypothetical protein DWQ19_06735 [Thermoproteota archaeon]RDJ38929.1 MAG: hypothetical protein DWQ13_01200 [Thermoproteota archaeon]
MNKSLYIFIFAMWVLLLIGGGIVITVLGPISISGYGELNQVISSGIKAIVAIILVVLWVYVLSKFKKWIFQKQISS